MYVVVDNDGTPKWGTLSLFYPKINAYQITLGYTVQPVTVTIELPWIVTGKHLALV